MPLLGYSTLLFYRYMPEFGSLPRSPHVVCNFTWRRGYFPHDERRAVKYWHGSKADGAHGVVVTAVATRSKGLYLSRYVVVVDAEEAGVMLA